MLPIHLFRRRLCSCLLVWAWLSAGLMAQGGLVHRWSFSEASGTNLTDSVGTANGFIAVVGAGADYVRGSGYVRLAGGTWAQADFMQMPPNLVSSLTNVTVEVWATPRTAQNWSRIFDFGPGNGTVQANDYYLSFCIGTSLNQQRMEHDPSPAWRVDTALATTANTQYHYVATWSKTGGPSGGGYAAWYRDGVLAGSTDTGTRVVTNVNDAVMWLGRSQFTSDNSANADYNEVRIYSHAMSSNEVNFSRMNGPDTYITPPAQASNCTMTTNGSTLVLAWTPGAGSSGSVVVMRAGQATSVQPNYGTNYPASAIFGSGTDLGGSNYVVFSGAGSGVTVTNLLPGVRYFATVYSYSGSGASTVLNLADAPSTNQTTFGVVQSITLMAASQLPWGGTAQAAVQANYVGGAAVDVTGSAAYSSRATGVVSVSASGVLTALSPGMAWITAAYQGFNSSNLVTVVNPLTTSLRHRYPFTTDASDVVGTVPGTLQSGAVITGGQLSLNGTTAYVSLPAGIVAANTNITLEVWVTDTVAATWSRIWDFGSGTAVNMFLTPYSGGGTLRHALTISGNGGEQQVNATPTLPLNVRKHIVLTQTGGTVIMYVDGVAVGTNAAMTLNPASMGSTTQNYLGKSQYADPYLTGSIDEFRIYDIALPSSIVLSNYLSGPDALPIAPPTTVNDAYTVNRGGQILMPVLANDTGPAPVTATLQIVAPPVNGTVAVNTNTGKILYTHNGSATLSDSFTYRVQGVTGATSAVAAVSLTISSNLRLAAPTMALPSAPPVTGYQVVDAFPGLTIAQPLALRTPLGAAYTNKLFILERRGYISYIDVTVTNPMRSVFLDISNQLSFDNNATDGELGLLGMEFHPGFATNGIFFTAYIAPGGNPYMVRLSRFTANPTNLTVNTNTQVMLFQTTKAAFNHNGCDLHFGNDGYLYMCMGDEGDQYNVHTNAQKLDKSLYSGILRIDVDKKPGNLEPKPPQNASNPLLTIPLDGSGKAYYSIPSDNPFLGVTNLYGTAVNTNYLRGEFYCIGMRHCWRFSIDPVTGEIWAGVVGQDLYEEVDLVKKGGNYGWPYYEGTHLTTNLYSGKPGLSGPPAGFVRDGPTWEYPHNSVSGADPAFAGLDVCGSLPYHGSRIPALTNAYLFGDFDTGGNIWALRRPTTNTVTVERLGGQTGLSAFGADPSNGDPLFCNYLQNKIQRLIVADASGSTFPQKLSDTGVFADLATLAPNPGIVAYEPNVTFWSDYAVKRRWFSIPDLTSTVGFATDTNWTLPAGMVWIKHFDLEMERGNPATKKRIETRFLVKTTNSVYGVSYKWNDAQTEADLVADGGDLFNLTITNAGVPQTAVWEIPSRSSCLSCHTAVGGLALTFNTRQMNRTNTMNGVTGSQMDLMNNAGYFSSSPPAAHFLPAFANATNSAYSLEYRVRSYLAVNCVQCHQPGGAGPPSWDARSYLTLAQTMLVNGIPVANDGGNPANKLVVPGDPNHSVVLLRLQNTNGFSRMPPLATHALDPNAISLVQNWIASELPAHITYAEWLAQHPTLAGAATNSAADPDGDGANNYLEYLTGTSPTNSADYWNPAIAANASQVAVGYRQPSNLGIVIETSSDLLHWTTWNVPGNDPIYSLLSGTNVLVGTASTNPPLQFFRAKILEP
jgi:uncharacterized repeat protein (TIGR03806 family)